MFILRSTSAHAKIDNATKVFFYDFIARFAVRFERVVFPQLPLRFRLRWMASSSAEASSYAQGFGVTRRLDKQGEGNQRSRHGG